MTDYDAIAKGWLKILGDMDENEGTEYLATIAFGMIPKEPFDMLMDNFYDRTAELMTCEGARYEGIEKDLVKKCFTKEFKNRTEKEMSLAIYRNARMIV